MIDKIPGQPFVIGLLTVDIEIRIYLCLFECPGPITPIFVNGKQYFRYLTISQGKQGLDIIPFREIVNDRYVAIFPEGILDFADFSFHDSYVFQGMPLKRRRGFGYKLIDADCYLSKTPLSR